MNIHFSKGKAAKFARKQKESASFDADSLVDDTRLELGKRLFQFRSNSAKQ